MGIRSFGLKPNVVLAAVENSAFHRFFHVTAEQTFKEAMTKCTSGLIFGAWQHELLGELITNILDLLPYEARVGLTSSMSRKLIEDVKGIKL